MLTFYDVLGVSQDAATDDIKAAHRARARLLHPDTVAAHRPRDSEHAAAAFELVQQAYETLSDPLRRAEYDAALVGTSGGPAGDEPPSSGQVLVAAVMRQLDTVQHPGIPPSAAGELAAVLTACALDMLPAAVDACAPRVTRPSELPVMAAHEALRLAAAAIRTRFATDAAALADVNFQLRLARRSAQELAAQVRPGVVRPLPRQLPVRVRRSAKQRLLGVVRAVVEIPAALLLLGAGWLPVRNFMGPDVDTTTTGYWWGVTFTVVLGFATLCVSGAWIFVAVRRTRKSVAAADTD